MSDLLKLVDKKADEVLNSIGIKNKDLQNIVELGSLAVGGYLIYKIWRNKNEKRDK